MKANTDINEQLDNSIFSILCSLHSASTQPRGCPAAALSHHTAGGIQSLHLIPAAKLDASPTVDGFAGWLCRRSVVWCGGCKRGAGQQPENRDVGSSMLSAFDYGGSSSTSTPQSAFANNGGNGHGFGMFNTNTAQKQPSFFTSPQPQPLAAATSSAFLATPASAFSTHSLSPAPPLSSAFPPPASAFATPGPTASPTPLRSAFGTASSAVRPPSHLIAPKPPSTSPPPPHSSKLSAHAPPFQPTTTAAHDDMGDGEGEEWAEGEGEEDGYGEDEGGGEVAEEEAEIHRLEEARSKRKQRFIHSTQPATSHHSSSTSSSSHTGTSAAKLAVARAAGMALPDDDDGIVDDSDELIVATAETRIKGQCTTMCTRKEVLDRLESHTISVLELEEGQSPAALSPTDTVPLAVKKYRRAAAAQQLDPRDVRTPPTLLTACNHLIDRVVDRRDVEWHEVHRFVTDRFRAVRSDFVCQGIVSADMVQCLEWMVRFHILAMDVLRREPTETFDPIQNMEKLTQTLTSLRLLYRDNTASPNPFPTPHQAEMQGYLLFTTFNKNFFSSYTSLSPQLQSSAPVQFALATYNAMRENNYATFFTLLRRASYLQLCLALPYIGRVREWALRTVSRAYQRYSVGVLCELLCMDDVEGTVGMLGWYGVGVEAGGDEIVFVSGGAKGGRRQQFVANPNGVFTEDNAERLVSSKRPPTKRLAIRTTLEGADTASAPASAHNVTAPTRRLVNSASSAKPISTTSAVTKPPPTAFVPPPSAFPSLPSLPPATSVATTTASVISSPVRLQRSAPFPPALSFPPFNAGPTRTAAHPPPTSSLSSFPPSRTSPRHVTPAPSQFTPPPSLPPSLPVFTTAPSFPSQQFTYSQSSPRKPSPAPAVPAPAAIATATFSRPAPFAVPTNAVPASPVSPFRPAAHASPTSTATLPLLRSLSSQQREERLQREAQQSLLRQQEQLERERTAAQLQLASQLHVASLLRRWQRSVQARRAQRAERERQLVAAERWYRQGLLLGCLLQWHGQWRGREERRESEAAMRRAMSEDQHGLSAVHAGLMTMAERVRQLYGDHAAASILRIDSAEADELDDYLPMHEDEADGDVGSSGLSSSAGGLDVPGLVAEEMAARNPAHDQLYFHLLVSVGDHDSPCSQLLLNKFSHHPTSVRTLATPRRNNQLLLLPSHDSTAAAPPLSDYTVPLSSSSSTARQLHVRIQREEDGSSPSARHIGYQGAVFLLSSAVGVEDVPSVVSHPDPHSSQPSTMSAFVVPPASRFEHDRQRLEAFVGTLHRHSALPLVILYPLAPSALLYVQQYGSAASTYFQQQAAMMMTHCLRLTNVDARVVADISISPLFLPATLFSASFTAPSDAPLLGYNDECLRAAISQLAASSPPHPVLCRIDVPDALEQRLDHRVGYLNQLVARLSALLTSAASTSSSTAAGLSLFSPQLYVDHFNACVQSFKRRLFTAGVKELSWPPEGSGLSLSASPSSSVAQNVRQLLTLLPLPSFSSLSSSTVVLDWSWLDCHSAIVAYLTSYRTLLSLTAQADGERDELQSALDSDLYTLYRKAYDLFATATPAHGTDDSSTPASVQRATTRDRLAKLEAWHSWLLELLEHRLVSELSMHPLMLDAQQHVYSLIDAAALAEQRDIEPHLHVLPALPAVDNAMEVDGNGNRGEAEAAVDESESNGIAHTEVAVVKRRKLDAHINGYGSASKLGAVVRHDSRSQHESQTVVSSGAVHREPNAHKDGLWLALEDEKRRQSRLNAMLDEIEANLAQ